MPLQEKALKLNDTRSNSILKKGGIEGGLMGGLFSTLISFFFQHGEKYFNGLLISVDGVAG